MFLITFINNKQTFVIRVFEENQLHGHVYCKYNIEIQSIGNSQKWNHLISIFIVNIHNTRTNLLNDIEQS